MRRAVDASSVASDYAVDDAYYLLRRAALRLAVVAVSGHYEPLSVAVPYAVHYPAVAQMKQHYPPDRKLARPARSYYDSVVSAA